jgi:hypothetical protein
MIARRFSVPMSALIAANPHKPTHRVGNVTTWRGLKHNEAVRLPSGAVGTLGDFLGATGDQIAAATAMANALNAHGYKQADQGLYKAFQRSMGSSSPDGFPGAGTMSKLQSVLSSAGIPMPNVKIYPWHAAGGYNGVNAPTSAEWYGSGGGSAPAAAPTASATPTAPPSGLTAAATAAAAALSADSNYCVSVGRVGTAVNTAVHNFKSAWNSANPSRPVPIGTGKYEPVVASALSETLGGATVPPGCGAAAMPAPTPAPTQMPSAAVQPAPAPASSGGSSAQIAAATAMNTALSVHGYKAADQPLYSAFQRSVGLKADGYPGTGTMSKLQSVLASAGIPMANVKVYPWRAGAYDGVNAPSQTEWTGAPAPASKVAQTAAQTAQAAAQAADSAPTAAQATQAATAAAAAANTAAAAAAAAAPADKPAAEAAAATAAQAAQAANTAAQAAGGGSAITPPEAPKKLSTGAIVAGAVGVAALVGVAAMAMSGGKKGGHRRASGGGRKRKPAHKKKSAHKRKKRK